MNKETISTVLFCLSILLPTSSQGMMIRKRRNTYFKSHHGRLEKEEAQNVFPKNLPLESQINFLRLFLYERTSMKNRKLMVSIFTENQLPHSLIFKLLCGKRITHKSFVNKLGNYGYSPEEATNIRMNLESMMDQITRDQDYRKSSAQIFRETMNLIYPREEKEILEPQSTEPLDDITKLLPSLSLSRFEDENPFNVLRYDQDES
jgi:hypothetical protein